MASEVRTIRAKRYFAFISVASSQKPAQSFVILISNVNSTNHRFDWLQNEKFYLHHSFKTKGFEMISFTMKMSKCFFCHPSPMLCKTLSEYLYALSYWDHPPSHNLPKYLA